MMIVVGSSLTIKKEIKETIAKKNYDFFYFPYQFLIKSDIFYFI